MARTYKRDARGRFSSTGASRSGRTGGGTLAARTSLRKSRAKLAGKDAADTSVGGTLSRRAQKGAVTRGEKRLKEVRKASTVKMQGMKRSGTIAKGGRRSAPPPAARPQVPARGTLAARGRLRDARSAAAADFNPSTARALTRANRDAAGAQRANRQRLGQSPAGRLVPGKRRPGTGPANSVRRTGPQPLVQRGNNIKPYRPNTARGWISQIDRQINRDVADLGRNLTSMTSKIREVRPKLDQLNREYERRNARHIANRRKRNVDGQVARTVLKIAGTAAGRKAITRRMQRALSAAFQGSGPAKRAVGVYLDQLAGMGPGRPSRGRNNIKPGPRNTRGEPRRRRRRKG